MLQRESNGRSCAESDGRPPLERLPPPVASAAAASPLEEELADARAWVGFAEAVQREEIEGRADGAGGAGGAGGGVAERPRTSDNSLQ